MITVQLAVPWHVTTPTVHRVMAREFVDEFFATGRLRLSSFDLFAKHPDEERGDPGEGAHLLLGKGTKQTVYAVTRHGQSAFVLSGSSTGRPETFDCFDSDVAVRINDTTAFGTVIARQLPGFRFGFEGPCTYKNSPIECDIGDFELENLKRDAPTGQIELNALGGFILNMAGHEVFFRKRTNYSHQGEYRWIWMTDLRGVDHLYVDVPEARAVCTRVEKSDL